MSGLEYSSRGSGCFLFLPRGFRFTSNDSLTFGGGSKISGGLDSKNSSG